MTKEEFEHVNHLPPSRLVTLETLHDEIASIKTELHRHVKNMESAFPKHPRTGEADFVGHGDYHSKLIDTAVRISARNEELTRKFLAGGLWATVTVFGGWTLNGAIQWLKDHLK